MSLYDKFIGYQDQLKHILTRHYRVPHAAAAGQNLK
jgi:hypothetical protein